MTGLVLRLELDPGDRMAGLVAPAEDSLGLVPIRFSGWVELMASIDLLRARQAATSPEDQPEQGGQPAD